MGNSTFWSSRVISDDVFKMFNTEDERNDFLRVLHKEINNELMHKLFSTLEEGEKIVNLFSIEEGQHDYYYHSSEYIRCCKIRDLVRCKDCIHNKNLIDDYGVDCDIFYQMVDPLGFCNYGEPREETGEVE